MFKVTKEVLKLSFKRYQGVIFYVLCPQVAKPAAFFTPATQIFVDKTRNVTNSLKTLIVKLINSPEEYAL